MPTDGELLELAHVAVMEATDGGMYPPGRRVQLEVAYCYLVLQHQSAIAHLLDIKLQSSAFALARPIYEALVKALWLFYCATEQQLERHAQGKELQSIGELTEALLSTEIPSVVSLSLHEVKSKYWKALSSLTHMGHSQIKHWLSPNGVEPDYPLAAIHELANFASFMCLVAGRELALRGGRTEGVAHLTGMLPQRILD